MRPVRSYFYARGPFRRPQSGRYHVGTIWIQVDIIIYIIKPLIIQYCSVSDSGIELCAYWFTNSSQRQRVVEENMMPCKLRTRMLVQARTLPAAINKRGNLRRLVSNAPQREESKQWKAMEVKCRSVGI